MIEKSDVLSHVLRWYLFDYLQLKFFTSVIHYGPKTFVNCDFLECYIYFSDITSIEGDQLMNSSITHSIWLLYKPSITLYLANIERCVHSAYVKLAIVYCSSKSTLQNVNEGSFRILKKKKTLWLLCDVYDIYICFYFSGLIKLIKAELFENFHQIIFSGPSLCM